MRAFEHRTIVYGQFIGAFSFAFGGQFMNELDRIREQIKRMRRKGQEPDYVCMCYELWDSLGKTSKFFGVACFPDSKILGRFEVR